MMTREQSDGPGFYFALPRLLNRGRERTATDSEGRAGEAYLGSIALFVIPYLAAWNLFAGSVSSGRLMAVAIPLVFLVWMFWLALFFLNSLVIKLLRMSGLFGDTPACALQHIFIVAVLVALAAGLAVGTHWTRWVGMVFLAALVLNFLAAAALRGLKRQST